MEIVTSKTFEKQNQLKKTRGARIFQPHTNILTTEKTIDNMHISDPVTSVTLVLFPWVDYFGRYDFPRCIYSTLDKSLLECGIFLILEHEDFFRVKKPGRLSDP